MKKSENKETIIPQVKLASNMCYAILREMSEDHSVLAEDIDEILDMAIAQVRLCIKEAQRFGSQLRRENRKEQWSQKYKDAKERLDKAGGAKKNVSDDNIKKSAKAVQHFFSAYLMLESFLAKSENRPVNIKSLTKMAQRLTKACFKDVKGVDVKNVIAELHQNDNEITVGILMPKNDEE